MASATMPRVGNEIKFEYGVAQKFALKYTTGKNCGEAKFPPFGVHDRAAAEFELACQHPTSLSAATMSTIIGRLMGELTCAAIECEYLDRNVSRPERLVKEAA